MANMKTFLLGLALCLSAPALGSAPAGYLFATFRGEGSPMTEQVYFLLSENGQDWQALGDGEPTLLSELGERGVRDPFLLRSQDGSKAYVIATDLSIHRNHDWRRAQEEASQSILIWESEDLVNWSEPRLVKVAPDDAGCAWAPEAVWDADRGEYMVFWASKTAEDKFAKHRIWAVHTKDFKSFGEPFVYIEKPTTVIDTTIIHDGNAYYRFTKDEKHKAITMETSPHLMEGWQEIEGFSLSKLTGYEGPACFQVAPASDGKPARWRLLLDHYARGRGYQSYDTDDLRAGQFVEGEPMNFPFHPVRHGAVLPLTKAEFARLSKHVER
jgi:hypothetical protein